MYIVLIFEKKRDNWDLTVCHVLLIGNNKLIDDVVFGLPFTSRLHTPVPPQFTMAIHFCFAAVVDCTECRKTLNGTIRRGTYKPKLCILAWIIQRDEITNDYSLLEWQVQLILVISVFGSRELN